MRKLASFILIFLVVGGNIKSQDVCKPNLIDLYKKADSCSIIQNSKLLPLIGVSASRSSSGGVSIPGTYIQAILKAGGMPVVIPAITDISVLRGIVKGLDGLVMTGGEDVNPFYYNEQPIPDINEVDSIRDIYDLVLLKLASDINVPILGICRGEQMINVAFGGSLYQDIPTQYKDSNLKHKQTESREKGTHPVSIVKDTELSNILRLASVYTNSYHHQAVKSVAPNFKISAQASDGIVEAVEAYPNRSIMGIQWHPEGHVAGGDTVMLRVFKHIIQQAGLYKQAKDIHQRILTVDTHCDTPTKFKNVGFDIGKRGSNQVNIPKMQEGMLDAIFFAAYTAQGPRDKVSSEKAVAKIENYIKDIHAQVASNKNVCGLAYTAEDLIQLKEEGKKAIFIGVENGYGIGKDISNLARFKSMGVNYVTLCHTKNNDICDSSSDVKPEWNGLSPYGREVVQEMNKLGILIDISHTSEKTFQDVIKLSKQPIIASHSSVRALCNHDRNLTDKQMQAIAQNGGVIQLCLVDLFLNPEKEKASLTDFINQVDYAVKIAGIDHVGIASDFDGGGGVVGCMGSNDMINITVKLLERGYTEKDIAKIWGGNFLRVLSTVQAGAKK